MVPKQSSGGTTVEQGTYTVPDVTIKELLDAIPAHCFERSTSRSLFYVIWDVFVIGCVYKTANYLDKFIDPATINLPHPLAYRFARFALWSLYGFWAGLFGTGLWAIGHECGHQSFSESKFISDAVGWVVHSALGVPYQAFRITHRQHHASNAHLTNDQVYVPYTRSELGLPSLDPEKENLLGSCVTEEAMKELWEALGDSPIGVFLGLSFYFLGGWPGYMLVNTSGQPHYPKGTNHFNYNAVMFKPHHFSQIMWSNAGIALWIAGMTGWAYSRGFWDLLTVYVIPYLWVNHWIILITFLQHTDPLLPHYRAPEFTFVRGALVTFDRDFLGDCGKIMAWIGAHATNSVSETHVLHHVCSKIPHYHAWEASAALRELLLSRGIRSQGPPVGWSEAVRVFKECKFVEDEGDVVFYKNARGLAQMKPAFADGVARNSGFKFQTH